MADLRLVLVTPEKTLFDRPVASLQVPLFDGGAGFYPGRAPLVGRLGAGVLRLKGAGGEAESYFIDGGFVQVKGPVVSVLTNSAVECGQISRRAAQQQLTDVSAERAVSDVDYGSKARRIETARRRVAAAGRE
ncbi:MAG: FoF1 ATP synthase subunit delta/epsilon [Planctomycetaceae bacterium]|jgi:F-type H+-transporting ATPase subunit epsilon